MLITVSRFKWTDNSTLGQMFIDGDPLFFSDINNKPMNIFTIEDKDRDLFDYMTLDQIKKDKVKGKTAIPYGRYKLETNLSPKFGMIMPILLKVPGFSGVRIHTGNKAEDTEGCLLPGYEWHLLQPDNNYIVGKSKDCFAEFFRMLKIVLAKEEVYIEICK